MKKNILSLILLCALGACRSSDDDEDSKDMTYPVINTTDIVAVTSDCEVYKRGDVIPLNFLFTDDSELGSYNV